MLFVVLFFIMVSSVVIFFLRMNIKTILMLALCFSLSLMFIGIIIFQAKNGGISTSQKFFLFFDIRVQRKLSYLIFPLMYLGYFIAIGRILFPAFFLMLALDYSMLPAIMRAKPKHGLVMLFPLISLILYYPKIFIILGNKNLEVMAITFTFIWIQLYLIISVILLILESRAITIPYCKKQFRYILFFLLCMETMYWLYFRQDPIQVYRMYATYYMKYRGVLYSNILGGDIRYWLLVSILTTFFGIFGFYNLGSYSSMEYIETKGDILIQKKVDIAARTMSVFVHGMKNQFLASKILISKLEKELEKDDLDRDSIKKNILSLSDMNKNIMSRIDSIYKSIKTNQMSLIPLSIDDLIEKTIEKFNEKHPEYDIKLGKYENTYILADKTYLSEALYNVLTNAYENVMSTDKEEKLLSLNVKPERLYISFEIRDNGTGMSKKTLKKIFEPFYTNKNTNTNWGLGLYYVKQIVKNHFGLLKIESKEGIGSLFCISIPKYGR